MRACVRTCARACVRACVRASHRMRGACLLPHLLPASRSRRARALDAVASRAPAGRRACGAAQLFGDAGRRHGRCRLQALSSSNLTASHCQPAKKAIRNIPFKGLGSTTLAFSALTVFLKSNAGTPLLMKDTMWFERERTSFPGTVPGGCLNPPGPVLSPPPRMVSANRARGRTNEALATSVAKAHLTLYLAL